MSAYTEALSELVALPRSLEEQLTRAKREIERDRDRREGEIAVYVEEHQAVLVRLEQILDRAKSEDVELNSDTLVDGNHADDGASADPLEYARQLVARLDEALANLLYTRDALRAEQDALSEDERKRAAEERRRRELDELRRDEYWQRAGQGTNGLVAALLAATAAGVLAGVVGSVAMLLVPALAAVLCFGLATAVSSTLPALAVQRATGSTPPSPAAPPRETRLAAAGYAAAALTASALAVAAVGLASGAPSPLPAVATLFAAAGAAVLASIWWFLPRSQ
jgi:hypothetical protein